MASLQALTIQTTVAPEANGLIAVEFNGYPVKVPYYVFVTKGKTFTGEFVLNNPFGTFWLDYTQTGNLVFTVSANAQIGGADRIKLTANGGTITLPSNWVNVGSTAISTTPGDVNRLVVMKVADNEVNYSVKVN